MRRIRTKKNGGGLKLNNCVNRIFNCSEDPHRLKTKDEVEADEDDEDEQQYIIEVIRQIKAFKEKFVDNEGSLKEKSIDIVLKKVYKKFEDKNLEEDFSDKSSSIYQYITYKPLLKKKSARNQSFNNSPISESSNSGFSDIQGVDELEGVTKSELERIKRNQKVFEKRLKMKLSRKKLQFYAKKSSKVVSEINQSIKRFRSKDKSIKVFLDNTVELIRQVKKTRDEVKKEWYDFLIKEIRQNKIKSNKFTYPDFISFLRLSERYDNEEDLKKVENEAKNYFKTKLSQTEQRSKLDGFATEQEKRKELFKILEIDASVDVNKSLNEALRGEKSPDEKRIDKLKELGKGFFDAIEVLKQNPGANIEQLQSMIDEVINKTFLDFNIWEKNKVFEEKQKNIAEEAYKKQLKKWKDDNKYSNIIYELETILAAAKRPMNEAIVKITELITKTIKKYTDKRKLQELGLEDDAFILPNGWRYSETYKRYYCKEAPELTTVRTPREKQKEFIRCKEQTRERTEGSTIVQSEDGSIELVRPQDNSPGSPDNSPDSP